MSFFSYVNKYLVKLMSVIETGNCHTIPSSFCCCCLFYFSNLLIETLRLWRNLLGTIKSVFLHYFMELVPVLKGVTHWLTRSFPHSAKDRLFYKAIIFT